MKIIKITKEKITLEVCYNNNRINKEFEVHILISILKEVFYVLNQ